MFGPEDYLALAIVLAPILAIDALIVACIVRCVLRGHRRRPRPVAWTRPQDHAPVDAPACPVIPLELARRRRAAGLTWKDAG